MSNFWIILIVEIEIKIKLLIVYYPQIDRQTERTNQTLETYLYYYMNYSQKNWVKLLPIVQLVLNNRTVIVIRESAFYANYGCHLNLFKTPRILLNVETILKDISKLKDLHKEILRNIKYQQR